MSVAEALPEVNARLLQAATAEQREIFETSRAGRVPARRRARRAAARAGRRGAHRAVAGAVPAPARRRAAAQRLGHRDLPDVPAEVQVRARLPDPERADDQPALRHPRPPGARALPRAAAPARGSLPELLGLLEAGWRRGGFGDSEEERQLRAKATQALVRYHDRFQDEDGEPVWFERSFQFRLGPAPAARPRRPRRPAARRRLRADRLQDRPPEDRRAAARGRPALAVRGRRARVVAARGRPAGLLLRARRREGAGRALRGGPRLDHRDRARGRRRASSRQGFEPTPSLRGVLDVRLPDRLPGGRALARQE